MNEMIEKINLTREYREYLNYIETHYLNIQKAWKILNSKKTQDYMNKNNFLFHFIYDGFHNDMLDNEVRNHDLSKLSKEEFVQYRQEFYPTQKEKELNIKTGIDKAWKSHKEKNHHHWQSWTKLKLDNNVFNNQIVHNFLDWAAMSLVFGGSPLDYYEKNKDDIKIPNSCIEYMYEIQECYLAGISSE